jgi:hypothetical protein
MINTKQMFKSVFQYQQQTGCNVFLWGDSIVNVHPLKVIVDATDRLSGYVLALWEGSLQRHPTFFFTYCLIVSFCYCVQPSLSKTVVER